MAKTFEILEFQFGDEITIFPNISENNGQNPVVDQAVYIVCQGQVRLVSFQATKQRNLSINLLQEGDIFGGDGLGNQMIWPYSAIAVGSVPVQVAKISVAQLQPYLEKLPELEYKERVAGRTRHEAPIRGCPVASRRPPTVIVDRRPAAQSFGMAVTGDCRKCSRDRLARPAGRDHRSQAGPPRPRAIPRTGPVGPPRRSIPLSSVPWGRAA